MFEIGFWELVLVAVVALVVVGPEKLPSLARTAGLWIGKARRMVADVKAEVDRELQLEELKQSFRQQADFGELKDLSERMKSLERDIRTEFKDPGPPPDWHRELPADPPPTDVVATNSATTPSVLPAPPPTPVRLTKNDSTPAPVPARLARNDPKRVGPPPVTPPRSPLPPVDPNP